MRWKCTKCGTYNSEAYSRCTSCGEVSEPRDKSTPVEEVSQPTKTKPSHLTKMLKIILLASTVIFIMAYLQKDKLPGKGNILPGLYQSPVQTETKDQKFTVQKKKITYTITPLYSYELHGLVVSHHDSRAWWDIYHRDWQDYLNTKDLLVVWGDNINSEVYRYMKFSNTSFFGYARFKSGTKPELWSKFKNECFSNNHVLPGSESMKKLIEETRPGDQIYLKGYLVSYEGPNVFRSSSITRNDTAGGACETIFVKEYKILQKANQMWRIIFAIMKYSIILSTLLLVILFFKG